MTTTLTRPTSRASSKQAGRREKSASARRAIERRANRRNADAQVALLVGNQPSLASSRETRARRSRQAATSMRVSVIKSAPFVVAIIAMILAGVGITILLSASATAQSYEIAALAAENARLRDQSEELDRDLEHARSPAKLAEHAQKRKMILASDATVLKKDKDGKVRPKGDPTPVEGEPLNPLDSRAPQQTPPTAHDNSQNDDRPEGLPPDMLPPAPVESSP